MSALLALHIYTSTLQHSPINPHFLLAQPPEDLLLGMRRSQVKARQLLYRVKAKDAYQSRIPVPSFLSMILVIATEIPPANQIFSSMAELLGEGFGTPSVSGISVHCVMGHIMPYFVSHSLGRSFLGKLPSGGVISSKSGFGFGVAEQGYFWVRRACVLRHGKYISCKCYSCNLDLHIDCEIVDTKETREAREELLAHQAIRLADANDDGAIDMSEIGDLLRYAYNLGYVVR
ncbi:hypothetical protein GH714_025444 [Hevea brasiliensis]|uniref:EF-hand domain-containing protein n=1 Tax=Hevea brasiliensis TaxID=3981 RepID=A0A6A6LN18_HEVBR|nr:hypothetical protein GH714_025444 [Hevea brasiliensis]